MCDYSLHLSPTRLAAEGERLVVHRFPGGSLGLASPTEVSPPDIRYRPCSPKAWTWSGIAHWFKQLNQETTVVAAVCCPPGARLRLTDIPATMQKELQVSAEEVVVFDQLSADAYSYRDCVTFENGRRVSLQSLKPGLRVEILALSSEPKTAAALDVSYTTTTIGPGAR